MSGTLNSSIPYHTYLNLFQVSNHSKSWLSQLHQYCHPCHYWQWHLLSQCRQLVNTTTAHKNKNCALCTPLHIQLHFLWTLLKAQYTVQSAPL